MTLQLLAVFTVFLSVLGSLARSPLYPPSFNLERRIQAISGGIQRRDDPVFPDSPASCPICQAGYPGISSCAAAAPVLANFTEIIFNPGSFIDVIECACTDTFQSVYPQCVDCFEQTNQTSFLDSSTADLPSVLSGLQKVCALASVLLGGVASTDGEIPSASITGVSSTAAVVTTTDSGDSSTSDAPTATAAVSSTGTGTDTASAASGSASSGANLNRGSIGLGWMHVGLGAVFTLTLHTLF